MKKRKAAYLQITRRCNNECVFCSNPQFDKEITLKEIRTQVLNFKKEGITEIILTGGEPTEAKQLPSIIRFIRKIGIEPKIITNGVNLSDRQLTQHLVLAGLRNINISIHTSDKDIAEKLSQKKGHLQKTLLGLRNAIDLGIDSDINCTINSLNCSILSETIALFIRKFPEVRHYVFNGLDPGKADGNLKSRAGENPWIVPRFVDFELELHKTIKILKKNNKTFRIERIPLCYMDDFEEFSTETRKIAKGEKYICSFIEELKQNKVRRVNPEQLRIKTESCRICNLSKICAGIQQEYIDMHGNSEIYPVFKDPDKLMSKIK